MRIAVVTETFHPFKGGSAKRYLEVFKRIAKMGHEVHLYTARLNANWPREEEVEGIHVHRSKPAYPNFITNDGFRSITSVLDFTRWVLQQLQREGPFDVLETNHCPIFPAWAAYLHAKATHRPLTITFHEVWQGHWYHYVPNPVYAPLGMALERTLPLLPTLAVAVSRYTADRLAQHLGLPRQKIAVIPNGVEPRLFNGECERDPQCLIYAGRINPHKRLDLLIEAFRLLQKERVELRLEIVGDGPLLDRYRSYVSSNGLRNITFRGQVRDTEMAKLLQQASVYVLPSIREGQSITTLEAMAAGTPQVVVEVDGSAAPRLVEEAGSGIVVPPYPKAIAEAVRKLLQDAELWRRFSENGRRYTSQLTWDAAAHSYMHLLQKLVAPCSI